MDKNEVLQTLMNEIKENIQEYTVRIGFFSRVGDGKYIIVFEDEVDYFSPDHVKKIVYKINYYFEHNDGTLKKISKSSIPKELTFERIHDV